MLSPRIKIFLVLFLSAAFPAHVYAENAGEGNVYQAKIDSIEKILASQKTNAEKYGSYYKLGLYTNAMQPDSSVVFMSKAVYYAKKMGKMDNAVLCMAILANSYTKKGDYESALNNLLEAERLAQSYASIASRIYVYTQLGKVYFILGRNTEAGKMYQKAGNVIDKKTLIAQLKERTAGGKALNNADALLTHNYFNYLLDYAEYMRFNVSFDSAMVIFKNVKSFIDEYPSTTFETMTYYASIADVEKTKGKYKAAIEDYNKILKIIDQTSPEVKQYIQTQIFSNLAICYFELNDKQKARKLLQCRIPDTYPEEKIIFFKTYKAIVEASLGNINGALAILKKLDIYNFSQINNNLLNIYSAYKYVYFYAGDYPKALLYFDKIDKIYTDISNISSLESEMAGSQVLLLQFKNKQLEDRLTRHDEILSNLRWRVIKQALFIVPEILIMITVIILFFRYEKKYGNKIKGNTNNIITEIASLRKQIDETKAEKDRLFNKITDKLRLEISQCDEEIRQKGTAII